MSSDNILYKLFSIIKNSKSRPQYFCLYLNQLSCTCIGSKRPLCVRRQEWSRFDLNGLNGLHFSPLLTAHTSAGAEHCQVYKVGESSSYCASTFYHHS